MSESMEVEGYKNGLLGVILLLCAGVLLALGVYGAWQIGTEAQLVGLVRAIGSNLLICAAIAFAFVLGAIIAFLAPMVLLRTILARHKRLRFTPEALEFFRKSNTNEKPCGRIPWRNIRDIQWRESTGNIEITLSNPRDEHTFWHPKIDETAGENACHAIIPDDFGKSTSWICRRIKERIEPASPAANESHQTAN
jgi:hypothetical protein